MLRRREFLIGGLSALALPLVVRAGASAKPVASVARLKAIEETVGGRLGVAFLDVGTGQRLAHRGDERFPMCSTFKLPLVAMVLSRVDRGEDQLVRRVDYGRDDLLDFAPVTREHVTEGSMTVAELCAAAIRHSDNTAANLLLTSVGGPGALTAWLRGLGDEVTRLDRLEPGLNTAIPGDSRDTTSPNAMTATLRRLLVGDALTGASRKRLIAWLAGNRTGAARLRAGLPENWRVGDKTGTGENGSTNDIAIVMPPQSPPLLIAAYLTQSDAPAEARNRALARVGRIVADWISG